MNETERTQALRLLEGDLGDAYRQVIMRCCRPIYWFPLERGAKILTNGTLTFVRTPERLLGVTAAHVLAGYLANRDSAQIRLQIGNGVFDDLPERIIDIHRAQDLGTVAFDNADLDRIGGEPIVPLETWPPRSPAEGSGIMLGGFPGQDRKVRAPLAVDFGLFTALGIARRVSEDQITWIFDREYSHGDLPPNYDLGGISGGPLIGKFMEAGLEIYRLSAIISEAQAELEYVVAKRVDVLRPDGTFGAA